MILLLGGTSEARAAAQQLDAGDMPFLTSLAGRVARPRLPVGPVRFGGFGGVPGLREFLSTQDISCVVDATHPFAEGMTANAVAACRAENVPMLRLERPGWSEAPGSGDWYWVDSHDEAAQLAAQLANRPFLTVGRQALDQFIGPLQERHAVARVVDDPGLVLPELWTLLLSRGPYHFDDERALMAEYAVDAVITKDSGGDYTWAKMVVAAERDAAVIVVRRGPGPTGITVTSEVSVAVEWAGQRHTPRSA